ncbi:MAG TPA: phenylacetate--CoA ligase [bacterium]|nr:phenylacetate--CoA ligase [bacterium]HQP98435.1 phenylacetate--CoA ligase [bacterium]
MPVYDPKHETMDRAELRQLQLEKLQAILNRVDRNVAYYGKMFRSADLSPEDFHSLEDLQRIPLTSGETLVENHPYGMFAVPLRQVIRLHPLPSKHGRQIVIGYTKNDVNNWTLLKARSFAAAGVTEDDILQVYLDYSLVPGALVAHYGAELLGACVIPVYNVALEEQIPIMLNYRVTALVCSPSHALHIVNYMKKNEIDPKSLFLRVMILTGERWSEELRSRIEGFLGVTALGGYGVPEICSPGIATECMERDGFHINEDHFLAEVIDPKTGEVLPYGREGELVLTTLMKEAFPLIRYRTGDITILREESCPCGRTTLRMDRVMMRTDDSLTINGMQISLSDIREILQEHGMESPNLRMVATAEEETDRLEIQIEVTSNMLGDEVRALEVLRERIEEAIVERLRIRPHVRLVEPRHLQGQERIVDLRQH